MTTPHPARLLHFSANGDAVTPSGKGPKMFVDIGKLHSGAERSTRAGEHAQDGVDHLAAAALTTGMFGDFDPAHAFHATMTEAHDHHVNTLGLHRDILTGLSDQARGAAADFTTTEEERAAAMRAVYPGPQCT